MTDEHAPQIRPARYAKGMSAVYCPSDGTGLKTRAMRLASYFGGRYSNREKSYIMSRMAAKKVQWHYDRGYNARIYLAGTPRSPERKKDLIPPELTPC